MSENLPRPSGDDDRRPEESVGSGSPGPPDEWPDSEPGGEAAPYGSDQPASPGPPPRGGDETGHPEGTESPGPPARNAEPPTPESPASPGPPPEGGWETGGRPGERSAGDSDTERQRQWQHGAGTTTGAKAPGRRRSPTAQNGFAISALILGIVGLVFALLPPTFWLGLILGVIGLVLGLVGWTRARREETATPGMAMAGTVLSGIAILVGLFWLLVLIGVLGALGDGSMGYGY